MAETPAIRPVGGVSAVWPKVASLDPATQREHLHPALLAHLAWLPVRQSITVRVPTV